MDCDSMDRKDIFVRGKMFRMVFLLQLPILGNYVVQNYVSTKNGLNITI